MTHLEEMRLNDALNALQAVYDDLGKWQRDRSRAPVGPFAYHRMEQVLSPVPPNGYDHLTRAFRVNGRLVSIELITELLAEFDKRNQRWTPTP